MKMINIKKISVLILLICLVFPASAYSQDAIIKEAEAAYTGEDYAKAIELYNRILNEYGESAEIYYNLGNAYYKENKIASSILNYERALLLDPGDNDIRFNLQMAGMRAVDKIEPIGEFFLVKWFNELQDMRSANSWGKLGIICFFLFIGCLILFFFSRQIKLKKAGFYTGMLLLVIVVLSNIFANNQKKEMENRTGAIVISPTITVKSSPSVSGTDLFILHEGTKVTIKSSLSEWHEIESENGNVGWMPQKDIEII